MKIQKVIHDFDWAFHAMREGFRVYRTSWNDESYIWIHREDNFVNDCDIYWEDEYLKEIHVINDFSIRFVNVIVKKISEKSVIMGWIPDSIDLFAEDWKIYTPWYDEEGVK